MQSQYVCLVILLLGLSHGVSQASSCTERGRFPNDENHDCRGYVICLTGGITNFTQYKLNCPQGSIYSHLEQQCTNSSDYKCYPSLNCTMVSNYPNPDSEDCSTFISCIQGMNDLATARLRKCSENTIFNSTVGECIDKNLTTCYSSGNKPVTSIPLEKPSDDKHVNVHTHTGPSNIAVSNRGNYITLLCILYLSVILV